MKKLVISMFVFLFALNLVYASPPNPMAFYGEVSYPGGISDGYYITAKIGNVVHGQCLIINNQYGYGENTCIVVSYDSGVLVNFYIGDTLIGNDTFESREIVNLNFTLNSLPPRPPILSNGICEINLGECSFNFLDCQVSLTTACAGNARCDVEIGETCATTPSDCGACPTDSISSTGGSPSSGGSTTSTTIYQTSTLNDSGSGNGLDNDTQILTDSGNSDSKKGISWLTGAVIGAFGETGSVILVIFVFLVIAGVILFFVMKTKEDKNIPAKVKEMMKKRG